MTINPYRPPATVADSVVEEDTYSDALAARASRFAAAWIDGLALLLLSGPLEYFLMRAESDSLIDLYSQIEILTTVFDIACTLAINAYLWLNRGQSIGKCVMKIQVIDAEDGTLLPLRRIYAYRMLWMELLNFVSTLFAIVWLDFTIALIFLIDVTMIFNRDRRCLHDYFAGSKVVVYRPGRLRKAVA